MKQLLNQFHSNRKYQLSLPFKKRSKKNALKQNEKNKKRNNGGKRNV